ncbi:MAG TPA: adenylate/guanylate cyclase domain-containing protein [Gaiellaceae bacterium]|nr:adenylate/guanylate cyclase domain-containing protein [Gaiellaceae bacterium]
MEVPPISYTRSGDVAIAYQVLGEGPLDLVFVPEFSNLLWYWQHPLPAAFFGELASFSRLILLDKRGVGLSDRPRDLGPLETRMDDIRAVLDAVGSERAALLGLASMGRLCVLFAATYPERTEALVTVGTLARPREQDWSTEVRAVRMRWGERDYQASMVKEGMDREYVDWWVNFCRLAASPGAAAHYLRMVQETDVSDIVSAVHVPALVFYGSVGDGGWELGQQLRNAQMVRASEFGSPWHVPELIPELKRFLTDHERGDVPDSVLTTLLFTDIVQSTERMAAVGDRAWRDLLAAHQQAARREIARFRGRELDTAGDGFFASFDGPARAIRCAQEIVSAAAETGLQIRVGVHTGECELLGDKVAGIAVSMGARIAATANDGEILVSATVKDLVAGSGIEFESRGVRELKGLGEWPLYAVAL